MGLTSQNKRALTKQNILSINLISHQILKELIQAELEWQQKQRDRVQPFLQD